MVRPTPFEIHSERTGSAGRLALVGELDIATVAQVKQRAQALLASSVREITIDLSALTFIDSSGLSLLVALSADAASEGWTLGLTRPSEQVFTIFQITGAEDNLPFIEDPPAP